MEVVWEEMAKRMERKALKKPGSARIRSTALKKKKRSKIPQVGEKKGFLDWGEQTTFNILVAHGSEGNRPGEGAEGEKSSP